MVQSDKPTPETLTQASTLEVQDKDGATHTFGELTKGKKTVVIFIRHFWCGICLEYVRKLSNDLPPSRLPPGVSLIIIGSGSHTPIPDYIESSGSVYPIYANPSKSLYKLFNFSSSLSRDKETKEYMAGQGLLSNIFASLRRGPMRNPAHFNHVGEFSQNGGEMVLEADGTCSFFSRMLHTDDHTDISEIAKIIEV